jgi:hypothetical protein
MSRPLKLKNVFLKLKTLQTMYIFRVQHKLQNITATLKQHCWFSMVKTVQTLLVEFGISYFYNSTYSLHITLTQTTSIQLHGFKF